MKFSRLVLVSLLVAAPLAADDAAAPEQRISAIEQKFLAGDKDGAQADVKRWMKADEKTPGPWLASARLRMHEKRYKKCLSHADAALERSPQNADAYYLRGRCFEGMGKVLEASNEYRAALKASAAHPDAQEGLSRIQPTLGAGDALPRPN